MSCRGEDVLRIDDRHILYRFLKLLDNELRYDEMMETIYHANIEERPTLQEIIEGYLAHYKKSSTGSIGVWVEEQGYGFEINKILSVEDVMAGTCSKYFQTTMEYLGIHYFPSYEQSSRFMKAGANESMFPVMVFSRDNVKIEIISYNQKTHIVGRMLSHEGIWLQTKPTIILPYWVHLIPDEKLREVIDDLSYIDSVLNYLQDKNNNVNVTRGGGASDRLVKWGERNALERENRFRFLIL